MPSNTALIQAEKKSRNTYETSLPNVIIDKTSGPCVFDGCRCGIYSEDTKASQKGPALCRECQHGRSQHTGEKEPKNISSIIRNVVSKNLGPQGVSQLASLRDAGKETNQGLHGPVSKASSSSCYVHSLHLLRRCRQRRAEKGRN